jgi:hypothetical protein
LTEEESRSPDLEVVSSWRDRYVPDDAPMALFKKLATENVAMPDGPERQMHTVESLVLIVRSVEDMMKEFDRG